MRMESYLCLIHVIEYLQLFFPPNCSPKIVNIKDEILRLSSHPLNRPFLLAQRTFVVLLDPFGHAAVVERVVAFTPNDNTLLWVLLTLPLASQTLI